MFTHMVTVKKVSHKARNTDYEILIYQVKETGEYRIYIAKGGFDASDIFTASQEVVRDGKSATGIDIVEELISIAIDDINRNEYGVY